MNLIFLHHKYQSKLKMITTYIITGANGHVAQTIIRRLKNEDCSIRGLLLPSEDNQDSDTVRDTIVYLQTGRIIN